MMMMMMMMVVVGLVVVSHLVNTTHDNLQLTGLLLWLTALHTILLLSSPTTDNVGVLESYHPTSTDTTTPGTTDDSTAG